LVVLTAAALGVDRPVVRTAEEGGYAEEDGHESSTKSGNKDPHPPFKRITSSSLPSSSPSPIPSFSSISPALPCSPSFSMLVALIAVAFLPAFVVLLFLLPPLPLRPPVFTVAAPLPALLPLVEVPPLALLLPLDLLAFSELRNLLLTSSMDKGEEEDAEMDEDDEEDKEFKDNSFDNCI
jgi:hypothetical protein